MPILQNKSTQIGARAHLRWLLQENFIYIAFPSATNNAVWSKKISLLTTLIYSEMLETTERRKTGTRMCVNNMDHVLILILRHKTCIVTWYFGFYFTRGYTSTLAQTPSMRRSTQRELMCAHSLIHCATTSTEAQSSRGFTSCWWSSSRDNKNLLLYFQTFKFIFSRWCNNEYISYLGMNSLLFQDNHVHVLQMI